MKKININIDNARILSYEVKLEEDLPEVCATIGLFAGKKKISTFSLTTGYAYSNSIKFDLPLSIISSIKDIAKQLEISLVKECNKSYLQLTDGKE